MACGSEMVLTLLSHFKSSNMVTVTKVRMRCNDCNHRYLAVKSEGGFWNKLSYSPNHCPKCGSKNVRKGSIYDVIAKVLGV
jgi:Zn finger protein HypA/HybF involved in hydrogenase expression